jgi:two-component system sensor histidine kinase YesM
MKDDIIKISVYDFDTKICLASSDSSEYDVLLPGESDWFLEAANDQTVHVFSVPYSEGGNDDYKINVSKYIRLRQGGPAGVLRIEVSFRSFIELVNKSNLGDGGHITIIDPDYEIVYTSLPDPALANGEIPVVRELVLGSASAKLSGFNMAVNVDTLSNTKWRICVFINIDRLSEIERGFTITVAIISLLVLVVGVMLTAAVARIITSPMKRLEMAMRKVEKSDYFHMEELIIAAPKEVGELIVRFNRMMRKISELVQSVIDERDAQRKSELKALQNQINPHFLYNTFDSLIWLIENGKNHNAAEMVIALASLFRIGISNDSEVLTVESEIEHVRNYLLIQSIRYADSFEYSFDVSPAALGANTMKLVLQPIVENCLYHGLKNRIDRGHILISARIDNDWLVLCVSDNGYGMRQETVNKLYESFEDGVIGGGVGLKNIWLRMNIYYRGKAQMLIESEPDVGTTITLKEPL